MVQKNNFRMMFPKLLAILFVWCTFCCEAAQVSFYEQPNFTGYVHQEMSSESCTNLPFQFENKINSIKTTDCIVVHSSRNCNLYGFPIKLEQAYLWVPQQRYLKSDRYYYNVSSFRDCTEMEKQDEVNLDIYYIQKNNYAVFLGNHFQTDTKYNCVMEKFQIEFSRPRTKYNCDVRVGGAVAQFRNMCGCKNLPKFLAGKPLSVNLYGKCVKTYEQEHCKGPTVKKYSEIDTTPFSMQYDEGGVHPILSIEPCDIPEHCISGKLSATIVKVELASDSLSTPETKARAPTLVGKQTFINDGNSEQEESYEVSKEITETAISEFSESLTEISSFSIAATLEVGANVGVWSSKISTTLTTGFETQKGSSKTITQSVSTRKEIKIQKRLMVSPCTKQEVTSVVKMAEDVKIPYKTELNVTGQFGSGERMKANEIREILKNLTFIKDLDEFTVIAEANAVLKVSYGLDTDTRVVSIPIPECAERYSIPMYSSSNRNVLDIICYITVLVGSSTMLIF